MGLKRGILVVFLLLCEVVFARTFSGGATFEQGSYQDHFLRVVSGHPVIYVSQGDTREFYLYIRRGDHETVLHNVMLLDSPDDFTLEFEPSTIEGIKNIDMVPIKTILTVPENIAVGDYPVKIRVDADEFIPEDYPLDMSVRVRKTLWANYIQIMLLAAGLCIIGFAAYRTKTIGKRK